MNEVKIACQGAGVLSIGLMTPFQGELKTLSKEDLDKIKNEILVDGFSFPIALWEDKEKNKLYILDGHQRHKALQSLKKDGYSVPEIPIVMVDADSYEQAKHKLLAAASAYGKVNQDGVLKFLADTSISIEDIFQNFKLDLNMEDFKLELEGLDRSSVIVDVDAHTRELKNSSKEIDPNDYNKFEHICPKCGMEFNDKV